MAREILKKTNGSTSEPDADNSLAGYEWLATAEGVAVYENKNALPRAFFVDRAIAAASHADALAALCDESFDARREVVIENLLPVLKGDRKSAEAAAKKLFLEFAQKLVDLWRYESGVAVDQ